MKAKKSLGQNFLKSITALNKIVEAGEISKEDIILEIGPGKGALTEKLLEKSNYVIAVEKDKELFAFLQNKFAKAILSGQLKLINDDILKFDIKKIEYKFFSGPRFSGSLSQPDHDKNFILFFYKIIANIPYNITGAILKKFLETENQPERMVLMVQNEVAKRIVANNEPESILSISVKAYGNPKIIMKVPSRYFSPAPKVDSAIISIKNISKNIFTENKISENQFWRVIHTGFAHKRKKLSSNLKKINDSLLISPTSPNLPFSGETNSFPPTRGNARGFAGGGKSLIEKLGDKRAEELTLKDWIEIIKMI